MGCNEDHPVPVPICSDCKHYRPSSSDNRMYAHCTRRDEIINMSVVDRGPDIVREQACFCFIERDAAFENYCGPNGRFFVPK